MELRARTRDLLGAIQALSQLSYSPETGGRNRAPAVQGRIVAVPARLPGAPRACHAPAPALLSRPLAAVLRRDRHRADDRGRRRAVPAARCGGTIQARRGLAQAQKTANAALRAGPRGGDGGAGAVHAVAGRCNGDRQEPGGGSCASGSSAGAADRGRVGGARGRRLRDVRDRATRGDRRGHGRTAGPERRADRADHGVDDDRERVRHRRRRAWRSCRCASIAAASCWRRRCPRHGRGMPNEPGADVDDRRRRLPDDVLHGADEPEQRRRSWCGCSRRCPTRGSGATIVVVGLTGRLPRAGADLRGDRQPHALLERSSGCCTPRSGSAAATSACRFPPRATTSSPRSARSSTRWRASSRRGWRTCARSAAGCRRRSGASASRSPAAWTASACSRSSCRPRSTAWAPRRAGRRCAGGPTRRWRRSRTPATPTPSTARCTPPRRR